MVSIQNAKLSTVCQRAHACMALLANRSVVANMNASPIVTAVPKNNAKTTNASRHVVNAEREHNVFVSQIIVRSANVLKTISDHHTASVVPNATAMLTVLEVNPHVFMVYVSRHVTELVELGLIVT